MVAVHGIGQQVLGEEMLLARWWPAMADGLRRANETLSRADVTMAFYGDLFRPAGQLLSPGEPLYGPDDVDEGLEQELLLAWWRAAADSDPAVVPPDSTDTLPGTPRSVQAALRALSASKFFAGLAMRAMVFDLKQVRRYLLDLDLREKARGRVLAAVDDDTRVVVAHSLGSVVAYEALCARPGHSVRSLVTLGSPLGIPNLILHRLQPRPSGQRGVWPGGPELVWTNIADAGDVVALVKDLRPVFGDAVRSALVHNGAHAHDATAYLTDVLCGEAIAAALG